MNKQDIFEIIEKFNATSLGRLKIKDGEFMIELERNSYANLAQTPMLIQSQAVAPLEAEQQQTAQMTTINAPIVGTFYAASSPESEPFVKVGDTVKAGQTVCLIEAMKMMSEVPAPCDCVIEQIMAENGQLMSFDAPIFRYRAL